MITGAAGGIGRALTRLLESRGRTLVLIDRDPRGVESPERHTVIEADLSDPAQVAAVADRLNGLAISCLINNAGVGFRRSFRAMTERELAATIDVNVRGTMLLTRLVLDRLVHDRASIANVASSVAYNPLPGMAAYAASKAMVASWSEALAHEPWTPTTCSRSPPRGRAPGSRRRPGSPPTATASGSSRPMRWSRDCRLRSIAADHHEVVGRNLARLPLSATRWLPRKLNAQLWGLLFERTR